MVEIALEYLNKYHFSVIPVGKDKKPLIKWEDYQKKYPTTDEVKAWWKKWPDANIAIVTGILSDLAVVDIDTPEGKEAIQDYLPDSLITPTVTTPRGGQHIYFRCPNPELTNNARLIPGCDLRANGGYVLAPPSKNGSGNPYAWVVNLDNSISSLPEKYLHYINNSSSYKTNVDNVTTTVHKSQQVSTIYFTKGTRDNDLFHVANCLVKGGMGKPDISKVIDILARNCDPPFPEKEIFTKVESAMKRAERRDRNLTQEVREYVMSTFGLFLSTDVQKSLHLSTREDQKALSTIMGRLCDEGIVQRAGKKNGQFKRLDTALDKIDYLNIQDAFVDIDWPFQLEEYVRTMPKNIIMIAGVSNAGKTAFLLNFVEMNMGKHDIHYFSSEMGALELKERLKKFERPIDSWTFTPYERAGDFSDVIKPDAINIIDFLEIYQEHYLIGQWIKDIYDKLNKGIAIIAIQKKPGANYGVGGVTTMEKARLYVSLDAGKLKIEKGKNWADPTVNPNYMAVKFKLVQGSKFIQTDDWYKDEPK